MSGYLIQRVPSPRPHKRAGNGKMGPTGGLFRYADWAAKRLGRQGVSEPFSFSRADPFNSTDEFMEAYSRKP